MLDAEAVFVGEVGLGGEVRPVRQLERRLGEAGRLGFRRAYLAATSEISGKSVPVALQKVSDLRRLIDVLFG